MTIRVKWIRTTPEAYRAIYVSHRDQLQVFGSFTNCHNNSQFGEHHIMTEWGFKDADAPLIKYDERGDGEPVITHWIAQVNTED